MNTTPVLDSWTTKTPMSFGRFYHASILLNTGKVLVVGGAGIAAPNQTSVELFDPVLNTWTSKASLAAAKAVHTINYLPNGNLLVLGGSGLLSPVEIYNPTLDTW